MAEVHEGQPEHGPASLFPLAKAIQVALALFIAAAGADVALRLWGIGASQDMLNGRNLALAHRFDTLAEVSGYTSLLLTLACAICWMTWQSRLAGLAPGYVKWSPGWHAGAWMIPVLDLWWPYRNMRDLGRLYLPRRGQQLIGLWWVVWVLGAVGSRYLAFKHTSVDSVASFQGFESWVLVCDLLALIAAVMGATLVSRLTTGAAIVLVPAGPATAD